MSVWLMLTLMDLCDLFISAFAGLLLDLLMGRLIMGLDLWVGFLLLRGFDSLLFVDLLMLHR